MDFLHSAKSYFIHFFKAGDEHSIHSPFVFNFYSNIIRPQKTYYSFTEIEELRIKLHNDKRPLKRLDLGAVAEFNKVQVISQVAKKAEKSPKLAQLLFRIAEFYKPKNIFDLGTSFGLTTSYLAASAPHARIYTFEGCTNTLNIAKSNFKALMQDNIETVSGNIDQTLRQILESVEKLDFAFFDANHKFEPTINYFNQCLSKAGENSIFIFDDIYWSREMTKAWKQIINHPSVMISIDLYYLGLVLFRRNQPKQHFTLKI